MCDFLFFHTTILNLSLYVKLLYFLWFFSGLQRAGALVKAIRSIGTWIALNPGDKIWMEYYKHYLQDKLLSPKCAILHFTTSVGWVWSKFLHRRILVDIYGRQYDQEAKQFTTIMQSGVIVNLSLPTQTKRIFPRLSGRLDWLNYGKLNVSRAIDAIGRFVR